MKALELCSTSTVLSLPGNPIHAVVLSYGCEVFVGVSRPIENTMLLSYCSTSIYCCGNWCVKIDVKKTSRDTKLSMKYCCWDFNVNIKHNVAIVLLYPVLFCCCGDS
ncbi:unnamed protein product [Choristocarpus tenellus]